VLEAMGMAKKSRKSRKAVKSAPDRQLRFEATIHQGEREQALSRVADFDLDRVPDPHGDVRLLVNPDELAQLLDEGYEIRLYRTVRPQRLSPDLIMGDDEAVRWLEERVQGIPREEGS
jgi:hypothetical protein